LAAGALSLSPQAALVAETLGRVRAEVHKVIIAQEELIDRLLVGMLCQGHILVEGVPGLAKTLTVSTLAKALDLKFVRIQFTPDLLPADLIGTEIFNQADGQFTVRRGPVFANLVLADEVNRAPAKVQSALLEAMQERQVSIGGQTMPLDEPFLVMATQNPIEQEGTYPLPEAQLDRFLLKVDVGFPSAGELVEIFARTTGAVPEPPGIAAGADEILALRSLARQVPAASHLSDYVARLVVASHPEHPSAPELVRKYVRYGASPRAGQAILLGAKVSALLDGRYNVSFEDIHAIAPAALRHRLLLSFEGLADAIPPDAIIAELLEKVEQLPKPV